MLLFGQHTAAVELSKQPASKTGNSLKNLHFLSYKSKEPAVLVTHFFFSLFIKNLELSNSLSLDVVCAISLDHPNFLLSAYPAYLILVPKLSQQVTEFITPDTDNWTTWSHAQFTCDNKVVQGTPSSQLSQIF